MNTPARVPVLTKEQAADIAVGLNSLMHEDTNARLRAIATGQHQVIDLQDPALPTTLAGLLKGSGYCVVQDWRPIESVPKGRRVWVSFIAHGGQRRTTIAELYGDNELELGEDYEWNDSESDYAPAGWYECPWSAETIYPLQGTPTHWMPKPPSSLAPTKENDDDRG